jgi:hypothetical protein
MKKILLLLAFFVAVPSFSQIYFSEDFEGATFPPTGWSASIVNSAYTWTSNTTTPLNGLKDVSVAYDPAPAAQNESLTSPTFSLAAATQAYFSFDFALSYFWSVDPNNNCDLTVSISTNNGTSYTPIWTEADFGVFSNFVKYKAVVNLFPYVGNANCKLRITYTGNDGAQAKFDNIIVSGCPAVTDVSTTSTSANSFAVGYTSPVSNVDIQYGAVGFTIGSGTTVTSTASPRVISGLPINSTYDYYVRANCGASQGQWAGPFVGGTFARMPLSCNFDSDAQLFGWSVAGNNIASMSLANNAALAHTGAGYWIMNTTPAPALANNNFLFSRPVSLTAGEVVTLSFWYRTAIVRNLRVTVGPSTVAASQTTVVWANPTLPIATTFAQITTPTFTAPTTGIYYFAFNDLSAPAAAATLRIDTISFSSVLSNDSFTSNKFSVSPNPTSDFVNISSSENIGVNGITVVDLNGRTVKELSYNNLSNIEVNLSDLSAGMYLMTIKSEQGVATKKIMKK